MEARCPYCGAPLVRLGGRLVCTNGHVVEEEVLDTGPEWRAYGAEEALARSRASPLTQRLHDYGVSTGFRSRDPRWARLAALHRRLRVEHDERLVEALGELSRLAPLLDLPGHVADTAAALLRRAESAGVLRGGQRLREYVAAALVAAARLEGRGVTINEAAERLGVDRSRLARAYRELVTALGVKPRLDPRSLVPRLASRLNLPPAVEALANRLIDALRVKGLLQGKPQVGVAAAAVYLASILLDEKRNQAEVARAAGVTDATIRNRYRDIVDNLWIEVQL